MDINSKRKNAPDFPLSKQNWYHFCLLSTEGFKLAPATHEIHKDYEFLMFQQQYVLQKNVVAE